MKNTWLMPSLAVGVAAGAILSSWYLHWTGAWDATRGDIAMSLCFALVVMGFDTFFGLLALLAYLRVTGRGTLK